MPFEIFSRFKKKNVFQILEIFFFVNEKTLAKTTAKKSHYIDKLRDNVIIYESFRGKSPFLQIDVCIDATNFWLLF